MSMVWREKRPTGLPALDRDMRQLTAMVNLVGDALAMGDLRLAQELLTKLEDNLSEHFLHEKRAVGRMPTAKPSSLA